MKNLFNNLKKYPLLVFFAVVLYVLSIADLFSPQYEFSDLENRSLARFPVRITSLIPLLLAAKTASMPTDSNTMLIIPKARSPLEAMSLTLPKFAAVMYDTRPMSF